ncbi:unnamed protein product [Phytomonas sp. Hart1]|nr:unnamed protein product [Phytomonas sp. Hart1]|eukprot:CCW71080.1 unnamed protein product [Phytomonas sp. isolate Hart1]
MLELDGRELLYSEFKERCLQPNLPAIIRHANGLTDSWFNVESLMGQLSPKGLLSGFGGNHLVPAYAMPSQSSPEDGKEAPDTAAYGSCETVPLRRVLGSWDRSNPDAQLLYYLKDWHMQQDMEARRGPLQVDPSQGPSHGAGLYRVPDYLGPDWLDGFCREVRDAPRQLWEAGPRGDGPVQDEGVPTSSPRSSAPLCGFGDGHSDYRFAYIGPTGTWTPLHYDVFGTYSWSFNVCGEKLWFFPTKEGNDFLKQHNIKGFPTPPDIRVMVGFEYWSFVQRPGELVFVPFQYYHQVHNIECEVLEPSISRCLTSFSPLEGMQLLPLTISVNHNWCNEFCIESMVRLFLDDVGYLRQNLKPEDMAAVYGPNDPVLWTRKMEEMLLNGTNWSFRSMLSFLGFIQAQFNMLDENVINILASLEKEVQEAYLTLYT